MPIIINDFEVVAPPESREQPGMKKPAPAHAQQANPPRPDDVELIVHRMIQRRLRLWAD